MPSFNLITEPWIPVVFKNGVAKEVSIETAFHRAHEIREVQADTPLETVAIYRLLLAVWLKLFGAKTTQRTEWFEMFARSDEGFSNPNLKELDQYFNADGVRDRFDLLHPEYPFFQWRDLPEYLGAPGKPTDPSSISRIFSDESNGNNPTLFSHQLDALPREVSLGKAARGIVATHATALQGGNSKPFYLADAPLVTGVIFWLRGNSLYESLILNASPHRKCRMKEITGKEQPAWERDITIARERAVRDYIDYLTFQSRRLLLNTKVIDDGRVVATGVWFAQGDKITSMPDDPLMAYQASKKTGTYPLKLREGRALWRDAEVFLNLLVEKRLEDDLSHAPRTLEWVGNNQDKLPGHRWMLDVLGLCNKKGAIEFWRHDRLPFIPEYVTNGLLNDKLEASLKIAEQQQKNLEAACKTTATKVLHPGKSFGELSSLQKEEVRRLAQSFGAEERYWALLEMPFMALLRELPDALSNEQSEQRMGEWSIMLKRTAEHAFRVATRAMQQGGRQLMALAQGDDALKPVETYYQYLKQQKKEAM